MTITLILNYSHPLTDEQIETVKRLTNSDTVLIKPIPVQLNHYAPLKPQVENFINQAMVEDWTDPNIIINIPALNFIAVDLMNTIRRVFKVEPRFLRLRPVSGSVPPKFEVCEIVQ